MSLMRKRYKEINAPIVMGKRGQVAFFVILAIVIVGIFALLVVYPRVRVSVSEANPSQYLRDCLEPAIDEVLPSITMHGGYLQPAPFVLFEGERIQYLCYTAENYKPCIVQQPLLVNHVQTEIQNYIEPRARECMQNIVGIYEQKGYQVSRGNAAVNVTLALQKIDVEFVTPLTLTKEGSQTFRRVSFTRASELYDLLMIATSIVDFSSTLGDSETLSYVQFYPDLKIEKLKKEGDTIYTVTNVVTKEQFRFATRSLVWPAGYGGATNA